MGKTVINLNAETIDLASIVESRNCFQVGDWSLRYNGDKNPAKFEFKNSNPRTLTVSIIESVGWVRFIRPLDFDGKTGIYNVLLTFRALTVDPNLKYEPLIYVTHKPGKFEKHSKFEPCDSGWKAKLSIEEGGPKYWFGFETLENNIQLHIDYIRVVLAESKNELTKEVEPHKTVELPLVTTIAKHQCYETIEKWNSNFNQNIIKDEYGFLLEYAEGLRHVQMLETFIRLVRYLVVKVSKLNSIQKTALIDCVKYALLISHDEAIVDSIYKHCPEMLPALDISEGILVKFSGLQQDNSSLAHRTLDKHAYFSLQDEPIKLLNLIQLEMKCEERYLESNPVGYCALANAYVSENHNSVRYLSYLNKFLDHYKLPKIREINLDATPCLSEVEFFTDNYKASSGPLVSIIMSAYQAGRTIKYAIESLLNQTYKNIEILVCDDCSEDKTLQFARECAIKDKRVRVYQSNRNQGTYNIRNDIISCAKGEYITFHDSDDFALPCRIEDQLSVLVNEHKTVCFTEWIRIQENGRIVYFHDGNVSRFCVVSGLAHRSVFERMPPFRSALVAADTEFYEQCKNLLGEEEIVIIRKPLILGLWSDCSLTKRENLNADHSGFVANRRREYSDIAARQRILGDVLITDSDVTDVLKKLEIYCKPEGVIEVSINDLSHTLDGDSVAANEEKNSDCESDVSKPDEKSSTSGIDKPRVA